jgi:hypothetical protein
MLSGVSKSRFRSPRARATISAWSWAWRRRRSAIAVPRPGVWRAAKSAADLGIPLVVEQCEGEADVEVVGARM